MVFKNNGLRELRVALRVRHRIRYKVSSTIRERKWHSDPWDGEETAVVSRDVIRIKILSGTENATAKICHIIILMILK